MVVAFVCFFCQSAFRGYSARQARFRQRHLVAAAMNIQRVFRGFRGRARARYERDRYVFSRTQSRAIECGRQMLVEHRLMGTKLQSEVRS